MYQLSARNNQTSRISLFDWISTLSRLEGAYSEGTLRAYRVDIRTFVNWCESSKLAPFPAAPETVAAFIAHEAQRCAAATIKRRLAALAKIHKLMKLENPISDEDVKIALRKALRTKLCRQHQALGITAELREQLTTTCNNGLLGKRNRAMISVGYDTLARRSELVAINYEDLIPAHTGKVTILIKRSKNDPFGKGRHAYLSKRSLVDLRNWLTASGIKSGPLFRAIRQNKVCEKALHPYTVNRIIKQAAKQAGLSSQIVKELSGHSMRIGAAQDMITSGLSILPIMAAGGWKTTSVVARYIENADLSSLLQRFVQESN